VRQTQPADPTDMAGHSDVASGADGTERACHADSAGADRVEARCAATNGIAFNLTGLGGKTDRLRTRAPVGEVLRSRQQEHRC